MIQPLAIRPPTIRPPAPALAGAVSKIRVPGAHWAPVLLALACFVAFWRSFVRVAPLLGADSPAALTPIMPFVAAWLAAASVRRRERLGQPLKGQIEGAIDVPIAAALIGVSGWLMWRGPEQFGWYFWSSRLDLLALPLLAVGLAVLLWGAQAVLRHKLAVVFALLIWPEPLLQVQQWLARPLAVLAAVGARPLAELLGAQLAPAGVDPTYFRSPGPQPWTLVVSDACSGLNAGLMVGLFSIPAAVQSGLSFRRWLPWMLLGVGLSVLSNVVRVASLVLVAHHYGVEEALANVHNVLGAILLAIVFLILWLALPSAPAPAAGPAAHPLTVRSSAVRNVTLGCLALFALASSRLIAFEPLPPIGAPGGAVASQLEYLKLPPGWRIEAKGDLAVQNLFGSDSKSYWINLRHEDGSKVLAQLITTPDRSRLSAYGIEACRIFHGGDVIDSRTVSLGGGAVATLIDTIDKRSRDLKERLSVLYWEAPFTLEGREGQMHARVALFVPQSLEGRITVPTTPGIAPGGAEFDRADSLLVHLARGMTAELLSRNVEV